MLDDSPEFVFLVQSLFKLKGVELSSEIEVEKAREILSSDSFALLIIDYVLPTTNGLAFIEEIRQLDAYRNTPIILLTAKKLEESEIQAVKKNGVLFLQKPIQPTEFYNKVCTLLEG
ncbi:MAG: response regulator [Bacteriovoracaceae bacterium]|nr:response regulator [Bacteriovoracaceae bacterium]